jgi:hemerythrin superfamily protein
MSISTERARAAHKKPPSVRQVRRAHGIVDAPSATDLLRKDHREVEALFKAFKRSDSSADKQQLAKKITTALKIHAQIEEEIFYPAFIEATDQKSLHDEALVEHDSAKKLIADIEGGAGGDPLFDAKVNVLSEMIKHHVKEEERFGGMFSKARMAKMDLRALGALLAARKQELTKKPTKRGSRARAPKQLLGAAYARGKGAASAGRRPA